MSIGELVFVMAALTAIAGLTSSLGNCFLAFVYNIGLLQDGLNLLKHQPDVADNKSASSHTISKGNVEINDINLTCFTKDSLRSQIAIVPQHLNLFHRSIFENIAYGCRHVSKEEVIAAAKKAKCHDFITSLEHQYETIIGEQGVKLSGGQRQRIAIARAILKNAPILLFDEATSALDSATEQAIQEALETLLKDKTALIIAHRLSTLKAMDKILVLENGPIVESGSHNELLAVKEAYYNYWTQQSSEFIR